MSWEIRREFEVKIPDGATPEDEEKLIEEATDRAVDKLLDDLGF